MNWLDGLMLIIGCFSVIELDVCYWLWIWFGIWDMNLVVWVGFLYVIRCGRCFWY